MRSAGGAGEISTLATGASDRRVTVNFLAI